MTKLQQQTIQKYNTINNKGFTFAALAITDLGASASHNEINKGIKEVAKGIEAKK